MNSIYLYLDFPDIQMLLRENSLYLYAWVAGLGM